MTLTKARVALASAGLGALLAGCTPQPLPLPPGPTAAEMQAYQQATLDVTWQSTGISAKAPRPVIESGRPVSPSEWLSTVMNCIDDAGYGPVTISWSQSRGMQLETGFVPGTADEIEAKTAFYICVARYPQVVDQGVLLSDAQLDYLYDYYATWLVPCLVSHGMRLSELPSRDEYFELRGDWTPYWAVINSLTETEQLRIDAECGPERPGMG